MIKEMYKVEQYSEIIEVFELENDLKKFTIEDLVIISYSYVALEDCAKALNLLLDIIDDEALTHNDRISIRKFAYEILIKNKIRCNGDMKLILFEKIIHYSIPEEEKLNIVFIKQAMKSIKEKEQINYEKLLVWLLRSDTKYLNKEPYKNQKFSDYDMHHFDILKAYCELGKIDEAKIFFDEAIKKIENEELRNLVKYNMSKLLFSREQGKDALDILKELLIHKRIKYYLYLPIRHLCDDVEIVTSYIIEILNVGIKNDELYILKYIFDWFGKYYPEFYINEIKPNYNFDGKLVIETKAKDEVCKKILDFCKAVSSNLIHKGIVSNVTKSGNAFVRSIIDNSSVFIPKQFAKNLKVKQKIEYLIVESYDKAKKTNSYTGIVLKGGSV
ncbi:MAG: hypothetical protein WC219_01405 [Acholeplasmataceae bacterium]